jgi:hypothetical protein
MLKTSTRQKKTSVAMARLNPLKSNGYKLMLWGHEASTYLCVGSLGFQGSSKCNKITINVNVKQQPFTQEVLMKNTYKIMKKTNPHPSCKPSNSIKHHFAKK